MEAHLLESELLDDKNDENNRESHDVNSIFDVVENTVSKADGFQETRGIDRDVYTSQRTRGKQQRRHLSHFHATLNALNTIWGASIVALPYAVRQGGLISVVTMLAIAFYTRKSIQYLTECLTLLQFSRTLNKPDNFLLSDGGTTDSYDHLAYHSMGWLGVGMTSICFLMNGLGMLVATVIFLVQCMITLFSDLSPSSNIAVSAVYYFCLFIIVYGVIFPLGLIRDLNNLRFAAYVTVFATIYLAILLFFLGFSPWVKTAASNTASLEVYQTLINNQPQPPLGLRLFGISLFPSSLRGFVICLSILMTSFSCHITVLPIYTRLRTQSAIEMRNKVVTPAFILCLVVYMMIGIGGALSFQSTTDVNVLNNINSIYVAAQNVTLTSVELEDLRMFSFRSLQLDSVASPSFLQLSDPSGDPFEFRAVIQRYSTSNVFFRFSLRLCTFSVALSLITTSPLLLWPVRSCLVSLYSACVVKSKRRTPTHSSNLMSKPEDKSLTISRETSTSSCLRHLERGDKRQSDQNKDDEDAGHNSQDGSVSDEETRRILTQERCSLSSTKPVSADYNSREGVREIKSSESQTTFTGNQYDAIFNGKFQARLSSLFLGSFRRPVFASDRVAAFLPGDSPPGSNEDLLDSSDEVAASRDETAPNIASLRMSRMTNDGLEARVGPLHSWLRTSGCMGRSDQDPAYFQGDSGGLIQSHSQVTASGITLSPWDIATFAIATVVFVTAIVCSSVETAFKVVGVVTGSLITFVFPPWFWLKFLLSDDATANRHHWKAFLVNLCLVLRDGNIPRLKLLYQQCEEQKAGSSRLFRSPRSEVVEALCMIASGMALMTLGIAAGVNT